MLILASKSPRRCELLKLAGLEFTVCPAKGKEELPPGILPADVVELLAKQKAVEIAARFPFGRERRLRNAQNAFRQYAQRVYRRLHYRRGEYAGISSKDRC